MPRPDRKQMATLLDQLDDKNFRVRTQAERQLAIMAEWDEGMETDLREALMKQPPLEVRVRIENVLKKAFAKVAGPPAPSGLTSRQLRAWRIVEVLERIGTSAARQLLQELIRSAPDSMFASEGTAALRRLTKR